MQRSILRNWILLALWPVVCAQGAAPQSTAADSVSRPAVHCGTPDQEEFRRGWEAALARGEVARPGFAARPSRAAGSQRRSTVPRAVMPQDFFLFEDTDRRLLGSFTIFSVTALLRNAANALIAAHGDSYDFIGYWLNFTPHHEIGVAFYLGLWNNVTGIGQAPFDNRAGLGLQSDRLQGFVMMWDVRHPYWAPGTAPEADFTRLVLAQEFAHRFAMFLPPTSDGRELEEDDGACGRSAHWNFRVDGQGSGMEIAEWVGAAPAQRVDSELLFNGDIPGGVWSYPDLYLMGYVSPSEMDAGMGEFRYMDGSACGLSHSGTISTLTSADLIAAAGPRQPAAASAQKHFRTAWVFLHLPDEPPSMGELQKAADILTQQQTDWSLSTLGRGTLDNTLDPCVLVASATDRNPGANPTSYTATTPTLGSSWTADVDLAGTTGHSHGTVLGYHAPASVLQPGGQLLLMDIDHAAGEILQLPLVPGPAPRFALSIPNETALCGLALSTQAVHLMGVRPYALSNAIDLVVGH